MKKIILSFFAVAFYTTLFSQTGPIVVTILDSQPVTGITEIQYEFSGTYLTYDIAVDVSFDGDPYQPVPEADLSGDLNNVAPGVRNIVWNGAASFPNYYHLQTLIRITATPEFTCGDQITDIDGNVYNTVLIGTQCWMKENLNVGTRINGASDMQDNAVIEKYCYNDLESNCNLHGGLYQWDEMMQYTTQEGAQGLCPDGWHVPSDAEWTALTTYVSSQPGYLCNANTNYIGKALAATTLWNNSTNTCAIGNNLAANNATGFSCLPGGFRNDIGYFYDVGIVGYWWTSTEIYGNYAWNRYLGYYGPEVGHYSDFKVLGFSARCLRDY